MKGVYAVEVLGLGEKRYPALQTSEHAQRLPVFASNGSAFVRCCNGPLWSPYTSSVRKKIRNEQRFASLDELKAQLRVMN